MVCCLASLIVICSCCLSFGFDSCGYFFICFVVGVGAGLFCFAGLLAIA